MTKTQEQLLLYWSGELDPEGRAEVEALLVHDAAAQDYLRELEELHQDIKDIPAPQATTGLIAEVLSEEGTDAEAAIVPHPSTHRSLFKPAVAAVVLLGLTVWFFNRPSAPQDTIADTSQTPAAQPPSNPDQVADGKKAAPLSKRLFNSRSTFASSLQDRKERRKDRQRLKKLHSPTPSKT